MFLELHLLSVELSASFKSCFFENHNKNPNVTFGGHMRENHISARRDVPQTCFSASASMSENMPTGPPKTYVLLRAADLGEAILAFRTP